MPILRLCCIIKHMVYVSENENQTFALGHKLGESLKGGDIVTLWGDLGAGKTVFTKGIAAALGICDTIVSPTFTLMNEYAGSTLTLYHYDAYRLRDARDAQEVGLTEYFAAPNGVCVIEWAENIEDALKMHKKIRVTIQYQNEKTRKIEIVNE